MQFKTTIRYRGEPQASSDEKAVCTATVEEKIKIEVPACTKADLRPAFIVHAPEKDVTIFLHNGFLFAEVSPAWFSCEPHEKKALVCFRNYVATQKFGNPNWNDKKESLREATEYFGKYLLVHKDLYARVSEPVYEICAFGYGGNWAGTKLRVRHAAGCTTPGQYQYSALDAQMAKKDAADIAVSRGERSFVQEFTSDIEVLLPEAVKFPRRITDPLSAIRSELAHGQTVLCRNTVHTFNIVGVVPLTMPSGDSFVLVAMDFGLRMRLPLLADGRSALNWYVRRNTSGVLEVNIDWGFLDRKYLDL